MNDQELDISRLDFSKRYNQLPDMKTAFYSTLWFLLPSVAIILIYSSLPWISISGIVLLSILCGLVAKKFFVEIRS